MLLLGHALLEPPPMHAIGLGLALHFSMLYYELLKPREHVDVGHEAADTD
ncbi:hypothetical protein AURDEDRAFT_157432 [Auricularia subglabra TFB-10046 SS5]|nr:hypothetical protein AURDEDRAFT_157432 [Auricularia subglabra TFB-10046 SS5]